MADINAILELCVSTAWPEYALKHPEKGLTKEEAYKFMANAHKYMEPPEKLNDEEFDYLYEKMDKDSNGLIDRKEFVPFIREFGKIEKYRENYVSDDEYSSYEADMEEKRKDEERRKKMREDAEKREMGLLE